MRSDGTSRALWAPWRMDFIRGPRRRSCFFCDYARSRSDRKNRVVRRGRTCFAVLNLYPYTSGHLLVAPLAHKAELGLLSAAEREELLDLLVEMQEALDRALSPDGFNLGLNLGKAAGAGVPGHLHFHVVPRWDGDTNFMPVVGRTRVIPEALEELYDRLQKALRKRR